MRIGDDKQEGPCIAIFGTYGFGNMGDAAVVDIVITGLRRNIADARIIGICQQPEVAASRHGIPCYSIFRDFVRHGSGMADAQAETVNFMDTVRTVVFKHSGMVLVLRRFGILSLWKRTTARLANARRMMGEVRYSREMVSLLRKTDLLVIAGSGQLNEEWGGAWRYPFALFRWCLLARLVGCKVAFLSVGAGTVQSFWGRRFCRWALSAARYRSVRDWETLQMTQAWGVRGVQLVPDMAFAIGTNIPIAVPSAAGAPLVGINPLAYCDPRSWHEADPVRYRRYVAEMVDFCSRLLQAGYRLQFVPNERRMDVPVIDDIIAGIDPSLRQGGILQRPEVQTAMEVLQALAVCDYVVASRFHGLLFAYLAQRPAITVAFHYKFHRLAEEMGQERYCLDIVRFNAGELHDLFLDLVANDRRISDDIARNARQYAQRIEQQFLAMRDLV